MFSCFNLLEVLTHLTSFWWGRCGLISTNVLIVIYMFCCLDVEWGACGLIVRISSVDYERGENC